MEPFERRVEANLDVALETSTGVKEQANNDECFFSRSHNKDVLNNLRLLSVSVITKYWKNNYVLGNGAGQVD